MGFFDRFRRKPSPMKPQGSDGVNAFGGFLYSSEQSPDLIGTRLYTTLNNTIQNTVIVGAGVRYFLNLIAGTAWSVEPNEEAGELGEKAAELVRTGLIENYMPNPWFSVVRKAAMFRYVGFSIQEWVMKRRKADGATIFADIQHRPQYTIEQWDIPEDGGALQGVVQRTQVRAKEFYVPRGQMLYCVDNTFTDNPDGQGVLRHIVEHARRLSRYEQLEGFGFENDLRGIPIGRVPGTELKEASESNGLGDSWVLKQTAAVRQFVQNHVKNPQLSIVLDSEPYRDKGPDANPSQMPKWGIELLQGNGQGLTEVNATIGRINQEIARVLGMDFLMLGGDGKGSLALSRDKTSMFATVIQSTLRELAWFAERDLVRPLLEMNGMDPDVCAPHLLPDPVATDAIESVTTALMNLATAGAPLMPNDPAIDQIRARLHLAAQPELPVDIAGALTRTTAADYLLPDDEEDLDEDGGDAGGSRTGLNVRAKPSKGKDRKDEAAADRKKPSKAKDDKPKEK